MNGLRIRKLRITPNAYSDDGLDGIIRMFQRNLYVVGSAVPRSKGEVDDRLIYRPDIWGIRSLDL